MRRAALVLALVMAPTMPAFAQAQDEADPPAEQSSDARPTERIVIDILARPSAGEVDQRVAEECEEEQDAARIAGEIVVCRRLRDGSDVSGFDKEDWERRHGERTQGPKAPDLDGLANGPVYRTNGSVVMVTTKMKTGKPLPPALIIDVEALPEAPPGSDADRVARGLPPLGEEDGEN